MAKKNKIGSKFTPFATKSAQDNTVPGMLSPFYTPEQWKQKKAQEEFEARMNGPITSDMSYTDLMNYMMTQTNNTNAATMKFNADEAQKSRDWSEAMSNTSHQREVADLQAAGLNPVLSANAGAAAYAGASASTQTHDPTASMVNLWSTQKNNATQIKMTRETNANNMDITKLQTAVGLQQAKYGLQSALATANATKAAAAMSAAATLGASTNAREAQEYAARMNYKTQKYVTDNSRSGSVAGTVGAGIQKGIDWLFPNGVPSVGDVTDSLKDFFFK